MILLLSGKTPSARAVLVERLQKDDSTWRHLAIEELLSFPFFGLIDDPAEQMELAASLACQCIAELREEPVKIAVSYEDATPIVPLLRAELPDLLAVHIGEEPEKHDFDHIIDTANRSASDIFLQLKKVLKKK